MSGSPGGGSEGGGGDGGGGDGRGGGGRGGGGDVAAATVVAAMVEVEGTVAVEVEVSRAVARRVGCPARKVAGTVGG